MSQFRVFAVGSIVRMQILTGIIGFLAIIMFGSVVYACSFVYGIALMVANGCWLASRLAKVDGLDVRHGQQSLYAGAAIRFVALIAGLLLAQWFGFHLLVVAIGMFIAQAALFIFTLCEYRKAA